MASLIEQLQKEALDPSVAIPDLLRKVKVVAVKLDRVDAVAWVDHELNGYPRDVDLPSYRRIHGSPKFLNPYLGWCPLLVSNEELRERMSRHDARQRVSEL